jgi:hypothetical protein
MKPDTKDAYCGPIYMKCPTKVMPITTSAAGVGVRADCNYSSGIFLVQWKRVKIALCSWLYNVNSLKFNK